MRENAAFVTADTATKIPPEAAGAVLVCGSHGGLYPGALVAKAKVRAAILCDAGIGLDEAGVASLPWLESLGVAAAAISHLSCRIGDTGDMLARGAVSRANAVAAALGVRPGMGTAEAAERLAAAPLANAAPPPVGETRLTLERPGGRRILVVDSAAMVGQEDSGAIVVTGSHGGLVGGAPAMALRTDGYAAVFNDAGIGIEQAGIARLPALDERGIAAFTVAAASARIGEARSSYETGVISAVNRRASALGAAPGDRARDVLEAWAGAPQRAG